ncbi:MAG: hypothetical protein PHY73_05765 [Candidatus Omnitrophica bacterium]|nr:hypothetical protein [Candidatus Omnitrophota bacterium]
MFKKIIFFIIIFSTSLPCFAEILQEGLAENIEKITFKSVEKEDLSFEKDSDLQICSDQKLGVKFLCNSNWEVQTDENAVMLFVSRDPEITLTIAKSEDPVNSIDQLTKENLKVIGGYKDGFKIEETMVAGKLALKVEGYSESIPEMKLADYYFVNNNQLYSFLFAVNPFEEYPYCEKFLSRIVASIDLF